MSETVRSYGFIALLETPVDAADVSDENELLYDKKSLLSINYEGTLVHSDLNRHKDYDERTNIYGMQFGAGKGDEQAFLDEITAHGLTVEKGSVTSYNCVWYNGGDSPIDMLTKEQFLSQ